MCGVMGHGSVLRRGGGVGSRSCREASLLRQRAVERDGFSVFSGLIVPLWSVEIRSLICDL